MPRTQSQSAQLDGATTSNPLHHQDYKFVALEPQQLIPSQNIWICVCVCIENGVGMKKEYNFSFKTPTLW
jgi:hypothetical protein